MIERELTFESDGLRLAGILRLPDMNSDQRDGQPAVVLLVHGSLEQDKDGNLLQKRDGKPAFKKNFFLEIARRLCKAGYAAFSWDKRGFGESEGDGGDVFAQARDGRAALHALRNQEGIDQERIVVLGQSAGVYTACLIAKMEPQVCAYILQGGLFRDYRSMMDFNYARVARYAEKCPENLAWVKENDLFSLIIGLNLDRIEKAAMEGKAEHDLVYEGRIWKLHHDPSCYLPENAPSRQFRHIRKPVLIVHGECDLNVPVEDATLLRDHLLKEGNKEVELAIIPGADHSFQEVLGDEDLRLRERMTLGSIKRPYNSLYFQVLEGFLDRSLK